jgi:hypothetical protein
VIFHSVFHIVAASVKAHLKHVELLIHSINSINSNNPIMQLSTESVSKIADALKPAVLEYIYADDGFTEYMQTAVVDAIRTTMGDMDEDLLFELGMLIFDRIELK